MMGTEEIETYLEKVGSEILGANIRNEVLEELRGHLTDHAEALVLRGVDLEVAVQEALAALGNPTLLGQSFDRIHNPGPGPWVMGATVLLGLLLQGGGLGGYLDWSAALLVLAGVLIPFCSKGLTPRRWGGRKAVAHSALLWGGVGTLLSLLLFPSGAAFQFTGWQIIFLPLFYGLLTTLVLSLRPPRMNFRQLEQRR